MILYGAYYGEHKILHFFGLSDGHVIISYSQQQYGAPRNSTTGVVVTGFPSPTHYRVDQPGDVLCSLAFALNADFAVTTSCR